MSKKKRLDLLLVDRGLAPSRAKAQAMILTGDVLVNDTPVTQAGTPIAEDAELRLREGARAAKAYVSRGAWKLKAALEQFAIEVQGKVCADIGASTGGFTQALLEAGAQRVHAVDVGKNQMDWSIRNDPRVVVYEGVNARYLTQQTLPEKPRIAVMDVSFISITKIMPALLDVLSADADIVTLIKPQFELSPECVGKGGIVRDEESRQLAIQEVSAALKSLGLLRMGLIDSPITGTDGNQEYLAHWKRGSSDQD